MKILLEIIIAIIVIGTAYFLGYLRRLNEELASLKEEERMRKLTKK